MRARRLVKSPGGPGLIRGAGPLVLHVALALLVIYTLVFIAVDLLPVDPARALLGPSASADAVAALRVHLGLDSPLLHRYFLSLWRMLHGDFGESFFYGMPASTLVSRLAPPTLIRAFAALMLGFLGGLAVALYAVRRRSHRIRDLFSVIQSIPAFCFLVLLLWLASRGLGLTPLSAPALFEFFGICAAAAYPFGAVGGLVHDSLSPWGPSSRHEDLLRLLHAPEREIQRVLFWETLPTATGICLNALVPVLTGITFAEFLFGLRGFGAAFIHSCERGDLSVIAAGSLLVSAVLLVSQRAGDELLHRIDPRIKGSE